MPKISRGVERHNHKHQLVKRNLSPSKRLGGLVIVVWLRQKGSGRAADKSHRSWLAAALQTQHPWPQTPLVPGEKTSQQVGMGWDIGKAACFQGQLLPCGTGRLLVHLGAAQKWTNYTWGSPFTELTSSICHLIWGNGIGSYNQHLYVHFDFYLSSSFFRRLSITLAWREPTLA